MDATNPSATPTFANRTPLRIGTVGLIARDLDRLTNYYRDLLGLTVLDRSAKFALLGAGGVALLEIEHRPNAKPDDQAHAGLYHTAFLMPTRQDHARWIMHIVRNQTPISGASDHGVSEAFYLDDPEGNGIEVYNDRPRERWNWENGLINMTTKQLDIEAILKEIEPASATYLAAPDGLRVGHIHLRVGAIDKAEEFYRGALGLELTRRRGGATFMSSGSYHHHVGANVWHSDGAGRRDDDRAGLGWFSVESDGAADDATLARIKAANAPLQPIPGGVETNDPFGTRVRVLKAD
ncbi:MAG: VOC family protein [Hyphomicrobiales bacterium]|nr:VOC family protein [Alphaproteobacteria bacterium]